jgi:flagellar hook-associated protein 3 FlgL
MYRNFLTNLGNTKLRYDKALSQSSSGRKLTTLSDNPSDAAHALDLRSKIAQVDQFSRNIDSGYKYLHTAESALNSVTTSLYRVITLAEQGATEVNDAQARATIAEQINLIRDSLLDAANTQVMGVYVFAGTNTDTAPYIKDPGEPNPDTILYQGNNDTMEIQANFSVQVEINLPGSNVFGANGQPAPPHDIFARLATLRDALLANDTAAITAEMGSMHDLVDQVGNGLGKIGNLSAHMQSTQGLLKDFRTAMLAKVSSLEDANMAEALSNLTKEEVGLSATLQVGARINRISLMDFLG